MAAAASVLAPTPPTSPLDNSGGAPLGLTGPPDTKEIKAATDKYLGTTAAIEKGVREGETKLDTERSNLVKPEYKAPVQAPTKQTNPQEAWASSAMALAVIGSLFTRTPLTTAMNAAASAIKGFREGDQQAFQASFDQWQAATKNAIELANFQQKAYDEALGDIDKRETRMNAEAARAENEAKANLTAQFSQFRDYVAADVMQNQGILGLQKLFADRARTQAALEKAYEEQTKDGPQLAITLAIQKDPKYIAAQQSGDWKTMHQMMLEGGALKGKDPLDDPKQIEALKKGWEASAPGKAAMAALSANAGIQELANSPNILTNPVDQLGMIDKALFMETSGSIRPGQAMFQKIIGAQTLRDYAAIKSHQMDAHPILGPDQIRNIAEAAQTLNDASQKAYKFYLSQDPQRKYFAEKIGALDPNEFSGAPSPNSRPPPSDTDVQTLKAKAKEQPQYKAQLIKAFDHHYGEGAAEQILGAQ